MPLPPYLYTYDPVGTSVANKRTNELHNVAPPNDPLNANFIVPRAAPFFKVGLIVRTGAANNAPVLVEGVDYILTHPFIEASLVLNKLIYGSIMFLDRQYSGDVYLTYQTLGGGYTLDDYDIVESLTNSLYNIRLVSWTQIEGLPVSYPGLPHTHNDYEDMVGLTEVVAKLVQMVAAINTGGSNVNTLMTSFQQHLNAVMSHSKSQVGLSLVPNYPPATQVDLDSRSNTALMTPYMTLKMLVMYGGASAVDGSGLSDDAKADKVTTVTGGGLATGGGTLESNRVITVAKAANVDIAAGVSDAVALTPSSGVHLIEFWRNVLYPPMSNTLVQIDDVNLVVRPGMYYLDNAYMNLPVNAGKIPKVARTLSPYGAKLEVVHLYNHNTSNVVVQQRLISYSADGWTIQSDYWRTSSNNGVTWTGWRSQHSHIYNTGRCTVVVNNTSCVAVDTDNLEAIAKEPDGFIGNYYITTPQDNVYTATFKEPLPADSYTVTGVIVGPDTQTVYTLVLIDKQPEKFSFLAVGLRNYNGGSNTFHSTQFKAEITVTGIAAITDVT